MKTICQLLSAICLIASASAETLVWNHSAVATHYTVYQILPGATNLLGPTATNAFNLGQLPVGIHTFTVRAWNQWGVPSSFAIPVSDTNAPALPPGGVTLASGALLTWEHSGDAQIFRIIVLPPGSTNWTLLSTTTVNTLKIELPPAPYQFRVSASNAWDEAWSEPYQAPPAAVAPGGLRLQPSTP